MPLEMTLFLPKRHRLSNKIPNSRHKKCDFKFLVREVHKMSQTLQVSAVSLDCLLGAEGKFSLLKSSCPSDVALNI